MLAPGRFGQFSNDLLIGQFGDGEILAYDPTTDVFLGTVELLGTRRVPVSGFPKHLIFYKVEGREVFVCVSSTAHVILKTCLRDEPDQRRGNSFGQQPCWFSMK